MKFSKALLVVITPIGLVIGLMEAYKLAGGLVILMAMMVVLLATGAASVVLTIRREQATAVRARALGPAGDLDGEKVSHER
jgi:hypothetical protein